jgi:serine/threonine-protein kinase
LLPREGIAKLSDFGLVKYLPDQSDLTHTGDRLGTIGFMPPEQFRDAKAADRACDIYALAMTFLLMVSGRYPFESTYPADWQMEKLVGLVITAEKYPELTPAQRSAIRRALSPQPADRYPSALLLVNDLLS